MTSSETGPVDPVTLLRRVEHIVRSDAGRDEKLQTVTNILRSEIAHYDWVGFYIVDPENRHELALGPYSGAATEHARIPFGRGICGQAAEKKETIIVGDVSQETNYLSCSINVKSEIVVPLVKADEVVAELDIDSHAVDPFTDWDRRLLADVCDTLSPLF